MVSAHATVTDDVRQKTKKMTRNCIQAHSSNGGRRDHVTKVMRENRVVQIALCIAIFLARGLDVSAQNVPTKPAESLYLQLGKVGLDAGRVYQVRGASLTRPSIQITLDDGIIGFTQDILGKVTGAFFEGDGEILITPPNAVERRSMSLFTGMAILEERFESAYFRFNDDAMMEMRPDLRETPDKQQFVDRWGKSASNLAENDAMRLLTTFSKMLPIQGVASSGESASTTVERFTDRFLHARLQGAKLGVFDVYYDSTAAEAVQAGQIRTAENGESYYDVWTSFSPVLARASRANVNHASPEGEMTHESRVSIRRYTLSTEVLPPKEIRTKAKLECDVKTSGSRTLFF